VDENTTFLIYGHSTSLSLTDAHIWLECKSILRFETLLFLAVLRCVLGTVALWGTCHLNHKILSNRVYWY